MSNKPNAAPQVPQARRAGLNQGTSGSPTDKPAGAAPNTTANKYAWWCPECEKVIEPARVTFEETHDVRSGGCGEAVGLVPIEPQTLSEFVHAPEEVKERIGAEVVDAALERQREVIKPTGLPKIRKDLNFILNRQADLIEQAGHDITASYLKEGAVAITALQQEVERLHREADGRYEHDYLAPHKDCACAYCGALKRAEEAECRAMECVEINERQAARLVEAERRALVLQADAERYLWLKDNAGLSLGGIAGDCLIELDRWALQKTRAHTLDAAIDAERKGTGETR